MLFMCYQEDIGDQFEFMQDAWANSPSFPKFPIFGGHVGGDPLIGQLDPDDRWQKWPREWSKEDTLDFDFGGFVTLKGGEYFFAPSLPFLKTIA